MEDRIRYQRTCACPTDGLFCMELLPNRWKRYTYPVLVDERDEHGSGKRTQYCDQLSLWEKVGLIEDCSLCGNLAFLHGVHVVLKRGRR